MEKWCLYVIYWKYRTFSMNELTYLLPNRYIHTTYIWILQWIISIYACISESTSGLTASNSERIRDTGFSWAFQLQHGPIYHYHTREWLRAIKVELLHGTAICRIWWIQCIITWSTKKKTNIFSMHRIRITGCEYENTRFSTIT